MSWSEKCSKITTIILDVDGVLTDGRIGYRDNGDEIKFFDVKDGHGIVLARRAGLKVGILSGRKSKANAVRAAELKLDFFYEGCLNKNEGLTHLLESEGLKPEECMYIGDDLVDAPPMARCGLAVAVGDGVPELDALADFRVKAPGGRGAVREAVEILLKEQGKWSKLLERYFGLSCRS